MFNFADAFMWYVVFLLSTTVHEAAHAFASWRMGDMTAYENGQVTLNPAPHIRQEPIGMIVVPLISFFVGGWMLGWASTPYDPHWAYNYPKRAAKMALAGPVSNLMLVIVAAILIHVGIKMDYFYAPDRINFTSVVGTDLEGIVPAAAKFVSILFSLNVILFLFNLLPVPPLDGSGILPLFLSDSKGRRYMDFIRNPAFSIIGLLIAWKVFGFIFGKLHVVFINLLYPGHNYQ